MFEIKDPNQLWIVVTSFVISFVLAFGIGANDVANSFGTSVGAKVLTLKQACILATVFEIAGSLLLGAKVSDTIRKGIIDPTIYNDAEGRDLLLLGLTSALGGSCVWLLVATFARVPVSGTHSIVGATVGFSLVAKGMVGVRWEQLGLIVASWFASPVLSALVSVLLFFLVQRFILGKSNPLEYGLRALPFIYGITLVTNLYSIFYEGPPLLRFHYIPIWGSFLSSFGIGLLVSVIVKFLVVPSLRDQIRRYCSKLREQEAAKEEKERERLRLEQEAAGDMINSIVTENELGSSEQAGLLDADSKKKQPRVSFATKIKARFARNRKRNAQPSSDDSSYANPQREEAATATEELPVNISRTPSESCNSLVLPKGSVERSSSMRDPLISSCSVLPSAGQVDVSVNARSTSTSKLDKNTAVAAAGAANGPTERPEATSNKPGKFRVERIESGGQHLTTAVRSACTSTTSIFREANKVDANASAQQYSDEREQEQLVVKDETLTEKHGESEPEVTTCCGGRIKCKKPADEAREVVDTPESARLFSFLQILTAVFGAFAHGGNDVSNAIGPLIGVWITASSGEVAGKSETPWWILLYGGAGISLGLWIWGRRVIQTLGEDLTKVTPSSGFCIELGAALTVLVASNAKLPVSTTHCKVGSVVGVGRFRSRDNVDWRVFRNIILAWFVTVPASAALGAALMFGLMQLSRVISSHQIAANSTLYNSTVNSTLFGNSGVPLTTLSF